MATDRLTATAAATAQLAEAGVASPRHDAEALLAWVLGVSRAALFSPASVGPSTLGGDELTAYQTAVTRRAAREPLQHITGTAAFRYLDLAVGPGVFVPRPETEVMAGVAVEEARRLIAGGVARPVVVDLCTGSGAVALAVATEVPQARVTAVELSPEAHAYAVRNATGTDVDVRLGSISDSVEDLCGLVHIVTANPPYIPLSAFESVDPEARGFDPPLALWSGADGLAMIREVAAVSTRLLADGGLALCEHADVQGEDASRIFAESGHWRTVEDRRDLTGRPRFVAANRRR